MSIGVVEVFRGGSGAAFEQRHEADGGQIRGLVAGATAVDGAQQGGHVLDERESGRMRLLAFLTDKRVARFPEVPTFGELGIPGVEMAAWIGLMAPKGLPPAVADLIRRSVAALVQTAALRDGVALHGAVATSSTGEAFRDFVARDIELTRKAIRVAGVQPE